MVKFISEKVSEYKKILKFLIAGGTAAGTTFFFVYFFTDIVGLWYLISSVLAFFAGVIVSFTLQKYWTFKGEQEKRIHHQLILFISLGVFGMVFNALGMYLLVDKMRLWYMLAQFITAATIAVINFFVYQLVIFKHRTTGENELGLSPNNKKKILIASGIYPPDIGGPATMLEALVKALKKNDFSVKILTYADNDKSDGEIIRVNRKKNLLSRYLKYFLKMWRLSRFSDLIYVTDTYSVGYFAFLIKKFTGRKYLVRFAGDSAWETAVGRGWTTDYIIDFQDRQYGRRIEKMKQRRKKILVSADGVIAVSEFMSHLAQKISVDKNNIRVIYNSVDFLKEKAASAPNIKKTLGADAKLIVTACRLTPWKGADGVIKILPELSRRFKNIYFAVLGDGPELQNLKQLAIEAGVKDRVLFLGRVDNEAIINYFRQADLFILNTNYEGLSHTLLEAMAAGTPVITTKVGGNPEVIESGRDGILVGYNNYEELLAAAENILSNDSFKASLVSGAKEKLKKFNWQNTVEQTKEFINQLV